MFKGSGMSQRRVVHGLSYLFLVGVGVTMLFPFLWMILTSLKSSSDEILSPAQWLPAVCHWGNYRKVWEELHFDRALFNSAVVTLGVTFGQVLTSSLAAFAFARLNFIGRDKIFLGYLATLMIPNTITMIPSFLLLRELRWINTYYALIIPVMFSAYGTFMLRQFFMTIPRELEEAAIMDGCSTWGVYRHVILPLSTPALSALSILTFMGAWRSFMWPLIVTNSNEMFTLPLALASFRELFGVQWTLLMAGSVIMIVPMLIVFIAGQRYFIEGIQVGAVKS